MLRKITIHNYKSIQDVTVDLTFAEGKAPNGWRDYEMLPFLEGGCGSKSRRVPILSIYGANASGKTNILDAILCFKNVIREGIERRFSPNRLNPKYDSTKFSVGMMFPGRELEYGLEYNGSLISHEWLVENIDNERHVVFEVRGCVLNSEGIIAESYSDIRLSEIFKVECTDGNQKQRKTLLKCLYSGYAGLSAKVVDVYRVFIEKTAVYLHNEQSLSYALEKLKKSQMDDDHKAAFAKITQVLSKFDFSLTGMTLVRQRIEDVCQPNGTLGTPFDRRNLFVSNNHVYVDRITTYHKGIDGHEEPFDFTNEESEGTRVAAGLVGICLWALETGSVVFFDELDRSLHPIILVELVHMFKRKKTNQREGLLVFTLHDTTLLEDPTMRVSEIAVVNNNVHTGTTLTRLSEIERYDGCRVRNVHNFRRQYLDGVLSGVPHPVL